ncbi:MAG: AAA family ATPase [Magnetococcales bacterium]|nr:AAA family ATPase [Magnetococcales bacterium]
MCLYLQHFGLREQPCSNTANPKIFFKGGQRQGILEAILYSLQKEQGIIKVLGPTGSGKTMMMQMLDARLAGECRIVKLINATAFPNGLLCGIANQLGVGPEENQGQVCTDVLKNALSHLYDNDEQVLVIIDDAHTLSKEHLEQIFFLDNMESQSRKLAKVILLGQPSLNDLLDHVVTGFTQDRVLHTFHLPQLTQDETIHYIHSRLLAVGYFGNHLFSKSGYALIHRTTHGLFRRINLIVHKSLLSAYADNSLFVFKRHVRQAIEECDFSDDGLILTTEQVAGSPPQHPEDMEDESDDETSFEEPYHNTAHTYTTDQNAFPDQEEERPDDHPSYVETYLQTDYPSDNTRSTATSDRSQIEPEESSTEPTQWDEQSDSLSNRKPSIFSDQADRSFQPGAQPTSRNKKRAFNIMNVFVDNSHPIRQHGLNTSKVLLSLPSKIARHRLIGRLLPSLRKRPSMAAVALISATIAVSTGLVLDYFEREYGFLERTLSLFHSVTPEHGPPPEELAAVTEGLNQRISAMISVLPETVTDKINTRISTITAKSFPSLPTDDVVTLLDAFESGRLGIPDQMVGLAAMATAGRTISQGMVRQAMDDIIHSPTLPEETRPILAKLTKADNIKVIHKAFKILESPQKFKAVSEKALHSVLGKGPGSAQIKKHARTLTGLLYASRTAEEGDAPSSPSAMLKQAHVASAKITSALFGMLGSELSPNPSPEQMPTEQKTTPEKQEARQKQLNNIGQVDSSSLNTPNQSDQIFHLTDPGLEQTNRQDIGRPATDHGYLNQEYSSQSGGMNWQTTYQQPMPTDISRYQATTASTTALITEQAQSRQQAETSKAGYAQSNSIKDNIPTFQDTITSAPSTLRSTQQVNRDTNYRTPNPPSSTTSTTDTPQLYGQRGTVALSNPRNESSLLLDTQLLGELDALSERIAELEGGLSTTPPRLTAKKLPDTIDRVAQKILKKTEPEQTPPMNTQLSETKPWPPSSGESWLSRLPANRFTIQLYMGKNKNDFQRLEKVLRDRGLNDRVEHMHLVRLRNNQYAVLLGHYGSYAEAQSILGQMPEHTLFSYGYVRWVEGIQQLLPDAG